MIDVLYCYDKGYFEQTLVSLNSLLLNATTKVRVNIITDDNDSLRDQRLGKLVNSYHSEVRKFIIGDDTFSKFRNNLHLTKGAYYRLSAPNVLSDIASVIYLDSDTLIEADIKNLFALYDTSFAVQGTDEENPNQVSRLGLNDGLYINSGILLMNLEALRSINFLASSLEWMEKNPDKTYFADQDAINVLLEGRKGRLNVSWNLNPIPFDTLEVLEKHPERILHFGGPMKPWNRCYDFNLQEIYDSYAKIIAKGLVYEKQEPTTSGQCFIIANQQFERGFYLDASLYYQKGLSLINYTKPESFKELNGLLDLGQDLCTSKLQYYACRLYRVILSRLGYLIEHRVNLYEMKGLL